VRVGRGLAQSFSDAVAIFLADRAIETRWFPGAAVAGSVRLLALAIWGMIDEPGERAG
jgi:hypothetical protein